MTDLHAIKAHLLGLLRSQPKLNVYDGEPPGQVPLDSTGRAAPYVCLYMSAGTVGIDEAMDGTQDGLDLPIRVTCAGGWPDTALAAIGRARAALTGAWLPGGGVMREIPLNVPVLVDRDVSPHRYWAPLEWRVQAL